MRGLPQRTSVSSWAFVGASTSRFLRAVGGQLGTVVEDAPAVLLGVAMKLDRNRVEVCARTWFVLEIAERVLPSHQSSEQLCAGKPIKIDNSFFEESRDVPPELSSDMI